MYLIKLCENKTCFDIHLPPWTPCNHIHPSPLPPVYYMSAVYACVWVIQWYWLIHLSASEKNVCSSVVSLCTRSNTVPLNRPCTVLTGVSLVCANISSSDDTLFYPLQTGMVVLRATALVERCLLIFFTVCVLRAFVTLSCGLHTIHSNGMTLLIYPSLSPPPSSLGAKHVHVHTNMYIQVSF